MIHLNKFNSFTYVTLLLLCLRQIVWIGLWSGGANKQNRNRKQPFPEIGSISIHFNLVITKCYFYNHGRWKSLSQNGTFAG